MPELLDAIEIETGKNPTASVIWLHGLGADGNDFAPIVPQIRQPPLAIRFVFPHAPIQPEDERGVRASQALIEALIGREKKRGTKAERLVLAGFSQGGAIALHTGLRHAERIAGIMALSTYVPVGEKLSAEASAANRHAPIFMAHGTYDPVIPLDRAEQSRALLESLGYPVEWREYAMPHSVCPEELADIGAWLGKVLGPR